MFSVFAPLYPHWQQCPSIISLMKGFSHRNFSLQHFFQLLPSILCAPLRNLIKAFKKRFSWNYFSIAKKNYSENCFLFSTLALCTPTDNNVIQNSFLKKHLIKNFVFRLRSSVRPLITVSFKKVLHENDFSWTVLFLENTCFTAFLINPLNKFYQTIQNTFFMKLILYN